MKKLIVTLIALIALFCLAGCDEKVIVSVDENNDISAVIEQTMSVDEFNSIAAIMYGGYASPITESQLDEYFMDMPEGTANKYKVNGVAYYTMYDYETMLKTFYETEDYIISSEEFIATESAITKLNREVSAANGTSSSASPDMSDEDYAMLGEMIGNSMTELEKLTKDSTLVFEVTLPNEIVLTNGVLSADKKTVTFDLMSNQYTSCYAYTANSDLIINVNGLDSDYTQNTKFVVNSDDTINSVTINGEKQKSSDIWLTKDGTYTICIESENSDKEITVIRDTKKPTVKKLKSGKTYKSPVKISFFDKGSGIATAKLNGKTIKNNKTIRKAGKYTLTVTDKAGNKTTVKFKVK